MEAGGGELSNSCARGSEVSIQILIVLSYSHVNRRNVDQFIYLTLERVVENETVVRAREDGGREKELTFSKPPVARIGSVG